MTSLRERIADLCADEAAVLLREIFVEDGFIVDGPVAVETLSTLRRAQKAMWMNEALVLDQSINALASFSDEEVRRGFREWMGPDIRRALAPRRPS